jgi:DNA-binding Lrp family transcriptional regulator
VQPQTRGDLVDGLAVGADRDAGQVEVLAWHRRDGGAVGRVVPRREEVGGAKMGRPVKGMVTVRLRPQSRQIVQGFRDFVIALPETLQVFVTTGPEDLLILVAVESTEALRDFVLDSLTKRREVAGVRTEVVFDHLQNHVVGPSK